MPILTTRKWGILCDLATATAPSHRYLWDPAVDQILADEQVATGSPNDIRWPMTDWQGTVRDVATYNAATNVTTIANHKVYEAFGKVHSESGPTVDTIFGFTGRYFDDDMGLQWNLNRWYDPAVGRWLSEDPIGFAAGDPNLYRYVGNSPGSATDPTGLWVWPWDPSAQWWLDIPNPFAPGAPRPSRGTSPPPAPYEPPSIQADTKSDLERYAGQQLARARDTDLSAGQRAAAIDNYLEARWQMAPVGSCERAATEFFSPRDSQPGIGGTSRFEQCVIGALSGASLLRGRCPAPEASFRTITPYGDPLRPSYNSGPTQVDRGQARAPGGPNTPSRLRAPASGTSAQMTAPIATPGAAPKVPQGWGNIGSHGPVSPDVALGSAEKWLGTGYRELAPGVYRSADGLRQFRMPPRDLVPTHGSIGQHVHFEALNNAGQVIENLHIPVRP